MPVTPVATSPKPEWFHADSEGGRGNSGVPVPTEVRPAALVVHGHDNEATVGDAIPHDVREARWCDASLHDVAFVLANRRGAGVRPPGRTLDGDTDRGHEAATETRELLLVPVPGFDDVALGERMKDDRESHTRRLGATVVDPRQHVLPRDRLRFA